MPKRRSAMASVPSGQNQAQSASTFSKRRQAVQRSSETIGTIAFGVSPLAVKKHYPTPRVSGLIFPCLPTAKPFQQDHVSGSWGDYVLRIGISFVVIGFALAGAIGGAAAQYFPPRPPPAGYPPPAHDPYPAGPPPPYQRADPYPDTAGEPYDDADDGPYPAQPQPTIGATQTHPPDGL